MKRLVVCLDGTWNSAQSGTNIYHLSNLIKEGEVAPAGRGDERKECTQEIYYSEGVGTHVFDSITGGAFGVGLSDIVREAYDWLVERYEDDDEIYIFGFSRGAFTARSLVGLVAKCGLLRRGAPIPPEELWSAYQILGRHENARTGSEPSPNWWEVMFGRPKRPFHPLWAFAREGWDEAPGDPPAQSPKNRAERLLGAWSRRVKITCVGVFDTVGSLGVDALSIPGLRSKAAQFHDTNLSNLCVNAFQALAIDEHRANFLCIPWRRPAGSALAQDQTDLGGTIEQRWFVGAHSNVGGGYPDDVLAQYPLFWMIECCSKIGLEFKPFEIGGAVRASRPLPAACVPLRDALSEARHLLATPPTLRDSFADFGAGAWKFFIRAKPEYRPMGQLPLWENGVVVETPNETLDPSVHALGEANNLLPAKTLHFRTLYNPPNLYAWIQARSSSQSSLASYRASATKPGLQYIDSFKSAGLLLGWLFFCGCGAYRAALNCPYATWSWAALVALVALAADWSEARINHEISLTGQGRWTGVLSVLLNFCLLVRLAAVALVAWGILSWFIPLPHAVPAWLRSPAAALVFMEALLLFLCFGKEWCATSMIEAGLGSTVRLQTCVTPKAVNDRLREWSNGNSASLLQPVVEALMRDLIGLIPTYVAINLCGVKLLLWAASKPTGLWPMLEPLRQNLISAETLLYSTVAIGGIANFAEDIIRLIWLRRYPAAPSWFSVIPATLLWFVKVTAFTIGLMASLVSVVSLYFVAVWPLPMPAGALFVVSLLASLPLLLSIAVWLAPREATN